MVLTQVDIAVLVEFVAAALSEVHDPVALVHATRLVQEHPKPVTQARVRQLPEIDRVVIELNAEGSLLSQGSPRIPQKFTLRDVLLDLNKLLLSHLISLGN